MNPPAPCLPSYLEFNGLVRPKLLHTFKRVRREHQFPSVLLDELVGASGVGGMQSNLIGNEEGEEEWKALTKRSRRIIYSAPPNDRPPRAIMGISRRYRSE